MLRDLLVKYLGPRRWAVAAMSGLLLAAAGLQVAAPRLVSRFINEAQAGAGQGALIRIAVIFLSVSLAARVVRALAAYAGELVAWSATNALRLDLVAHLLRLDLAFHKERTPGELIERVDGDVSALAGLFSRLMIELLGALLLLAAVVISLIAVDFALGLAFGGFAALTVATLAWIRALAVPRQAADREQSAQTYGLAGEVLSATEDLCAAGATGYAIERFAARLRAWRPVRYAAELSGTAVWVAATLAFGVADGMAYLLGGRLFLLGRVSLGAVYMVAAYAAALAQPIETIRREMQELQRAGAGVRRVRELLSLRSRVPDGDAALPPGALPVEFRNVRFSYDGQSDALSGLTLRLEAGRTLGVVGRTGCGKSTIARLLVRQYDPSEGQVLVGGLDLRTVSLASLRSRIGMVTQEVQLFGASLRENITLFDPTVPDERLRAILGELGLDGWALEMPVAPGSLSAGEAQLLAFARVLLRDPGVVIMDEPSSRLDPATEARLNRAMQKLMTGRTGVIIAHRPATLERVDAVLHLKGVAP
ncbi:MAG TPA: ABC transporter ATP-binding protein [Symbiobacteriaceae bacterium]|nr:ABC transporter ATP-binding protein [Symbiobacteriaceae bacterium]